MKPSVHIEGRNTWSLPSAIVAQLYLPPTPTRPNIVYRFFSLHLYLHLSLHLYLCLYLCLHFYFQHMVPAKCHCWPTLSALLRPNVVRPSLKKSFVRRQSGLDAATSREILANLP